MHLDSDSEQAFGGRMIGVFYAEGDDVKPFQLFWRDADLQAWLDTDLEPGHPEEGTWRGQWDRGSITTLRCDVAGLVWNNLDADPKPEFVDPREACLACSDMAEALQEAPEPKATDFFEFAQRYLSWHRGARAEALAQASYRTRGQDL